MNRRAGDHDDTLAVLLDLARVLALAGRSPERHARDDYPSHPIKLIVPYAPGGGADAVGAHRRQARQRDHRPADRGREPRRRRLDHRHRGRAQIRARRLHAPARPVRADLDQSRRLQGTALRSGKGFRADHHDHGLSLYPRGQRQAAGRRRSPISSLWRKRSPANSITAPPASAPPIISSPNFSAAGPG